MLWLDLNFIIDLAVVTMAFKILSGLYLVNHRLYKVNTCQGHWLRGCRCVTS